MSDPWRYRCPQGHASIEPRVGEGYRCQACEAEYDGDPIDLKAGETSDAEPQTPIHPLVATERLWHATGDVDATARAQQFAERTTAMAAALQRAEAKGLVTRIERSGASRWSVRRKALWLIDGVSE